MQVIPYAEPLRKRIATREAGILFACGVLLIFFGAMVGVVGGSSALMMMRQGSPNRAEMARGVTVMLVSIAACAGMILTGAGSMRMRRWSRVVVLCACGNFLAFACLTLLVMVVMHTTAPPPPPVLITLRQAGGAQARASRQAVVDETAVLVFGAALVALVLAVPLCFFLVYRSRRVTLALEDADRTQSWIDGRPMSAIGLVMALGTFAIAMFISLFHLPPIPVGYVSGDAAEAREFLSGAMIVLAVFYTWAAWLIFRLKPIGPWVALLLIGLTAGASLAAMTNEALRDSFGPPNERYSPFELDWRLQLASGRSVFVVGTYAIAAAIYVLYVRRLLRDMNAPADIERQMS